MPNKMLIDAGHPEETRVVVLRGNRVEEFDFESANKKQLRGNIYLAKVTRVEPSLQAAFVDYGGNRHGFLAFSEIHPDYYQIPVADRQALLEEDARAQRAEDENEARGVARRRRRRSHGGAESREKRNADRDETVSESFEDGSVVDAGAAHEAEPGETRFSPSADESDDPAVADAAAFEELQPFEPEPHSEASPEAPPAHAEPEAAAPVESAEAEASPLSIEPEATEASYATEAADDDVPEALEPAKADDDAGLEARRDAGDESEADDEDDEEEEGEDGEPAPVEQIGGDALEEIPHRPMRPRRQYKIQEVIKRRQVLLVQVAKEERGTKGAALTTYLSLAGRYSVLMPNTARGGGISRKITNALDRKRLKTIAEDLEVPEGMGIILRTAGASRTKAEVKRDFEYLLRMWETVREVTLKSTAPTLVYEEGSLIKRAIRDLYNKDIDEVVVAGEDGYREAKEFMRMLMPSHAKNVKLYKDVQPMFARAGAEAQLDAMFTNQVTLRSGGYIVINQTEALVAIDVNSGRSTREHNIEDTALRTNLEAADEVARQLRLRDLAGLIVVDFIDMEESRNNRSVERRMKEALKNDRARIQIGRISHFGLLEMSRQRIRTGVLEGSTVLCPHCMGAGMVRSTSSVALHVLRGLEDALIKNAEFNVNVRTRTEVALYVLNHKRSHLRDLEARFGVVITVSADPTLTGVVYFAIERGEPATPLPDSRRTQDLVRVDSVQPIYEDEDEAETAAVDEAELEDEPTAAEPDADADEGDEREPGERQARDGGEDRPGSEGEASRRRRRRRRRRGRDRDGRPLASPNGAQPSDAGLAIVGEIAGDVPALGPDDLTHGAEAEPFDGVPDVAATVAGEADPPARGREDRRPGRRPRRDDHHRARDSERDTLPVFAEPAPAHAEEELPEAAAGDHAAPASGDGPSRPATDDAPTLPFDAPTSSGAADEPASAAAAADAPAETAAAVEPPKTEPEPASSPEAQPVAPAELDEPAYAGEPRPKRSGWWQRAKASLGG